MCILGPKVSLDTVGVDEDVSRTSALISEAVSMMIVSRNDWGGGDEYHS